MLSITVSSSLESAFANVVDSLSDIDGKPFPLEALWDYVTQDESHRPRPEDEEYWRIANWRDEIARVAWE